MRFRWKLPFSEHPQGPKSCQDNGDASQEGEDQGADIAKSGLPRIAALSWAAPLLHDEWSCTTLEGSLYDAHVIPYDGCSTFE